MMDSTNIVNWKWLSRLYYEIGKQYTDFHLQIAFKNQDGEQGWSRRRSYLTIAILEDKDWIEKANNRTLLKNEVVLDYDKLIYEADVLKEGQILAAITYCKRRGIKYAVYHTGSRGVHFHMFIDKLAYMNQNDRYEIRKRLIARFCGAEAFKPNFVGDYAKTSDKVPIALEFAPHWKTGKPKILIDSNFIFQ